MNQQTDMYMDAHKLSDAVRSKTNVIKLLYILRILDVAIPAVIILFEFILNWDEKFDTFVLGLLIVLAIPGYFLIDKLYKTKEKELRDFMGRNVIASVLAECMQIMEYQPNGCINENVLRNSNIFQHYDRLEGSEYIHGIYRGAEFCFCNLKLFDEFRSPDGDNDCREIFSGWFMLLPLKKPLAGYVKQQSLEHMMSMEGRVKMYFSGNMAYIAVDDVKELFDIGGKNKPAGNVIEESRQRYREDLIKILSVLDVVILNSNLF